MHTIENESESVLGAFTRLSDGVSAETLPETSPEPYPEPYPEPSERYPKGWISEGTLQRLHRLSVQCRKYDADPLSIPKEQRLELSLMFAATLHDFVEFAALGMQFLGFRLSDIQADIALYMQTGPRKRMVQAQRSQAKSTLAALYCVWRLIQNPQSRVLVVSAGEAQASDVARIQIRLIEQWYLLCWLRASPSHGDRNSFAAYDVHWHLRNVDKTASISCVGITANLQGPRADVLVPDDIESQRNSLTQPMREQLLLLSKEFSAICTHGDILYLGTPQSKDSVYRSLPNRGFDIRIWPSRYPTQEELLRYAPDTIAPLIMQRLRNNPALQTGGGITGLRGQPCDPQVMPEQTLCEKELDYGDDGYALQYQLDTSLLDAQRTKIKLADMPVVSFGFETAPELVQWSAEPRLLYRGMHPAISLEKMYSAASTSAEFCKYQSIVMHVDPAGTGGDEIAFCIGASANGYMHLFSCGGLVGGTSLENINKLLDLAMDFNCPLIRVEKNMGHGTVAALFLSEIRNRGLQIAVQEYYVTGQKERRIIDTISPVTRRHKLLVHSTAIEDDWKYCLQHPADRRQQFSLFRQLADITYDRGSLAHDDRADCLQAMVAYFAAFLSLDQEAEGQKRRALEVQEFLQRPLGVGAGCPDFGKKPRGARRKRMITY